MHLHFIYIVHLQRDLHHVSSKESEKSEIYPIPPVFFLSYISSQGTRDNSHAITISRLAPQKKN